MLCRVVACFAQHERVTLPWERAGLKPEPVKYVTRYEKAREECEFNPVLGVFTDPSKASSLGVAQTSSPVSGL